jgi:ankyrin repeat protein
MRVFFSFWKWPTIVPTQYLNLVSFTNSIYNIFQRTWIRFHTTGTTSEYDTGGKNMRGRFTSLAILIVLLISGFSICLATESSDPNDRSKYLDAVRTFADNVLKYGRDTYGPKHTPLFVDGLNVHTHEPVKWIAPNGDRWILSNLASQQNLFRVLDGLTKITGDPKYKQAAMDAIRYAFDNLRSPNGLLYWGRSMAYDAEADEICMPHNDHVLKHNYPYYELMWQVDSKATKQFIESFWSAHIIDWSNLDMNRIAKIYEPLERAWKQNYKGGPVFFESELPWALSFHITASDLYFAGSLLYKLSGKKEPLVWSKRLAYRYIETRDPKIGISGDLYSRKQIDRAMNQFGDDFKDHLVLEGTLFPASPLSPASLAIHVRGWIDQLILGDLLGPDGAEFTKWALEELTAWGNVAYHKEDNSFIPMLTDGTSLVGYVFKKDGYYGPEGTVVHAMEAGPICFWAYALAYRITGDPFMWEMTRSIAYGNNLGDIGATPIDQPAFGIDIDCSEPYALLGFLELYARSQKKSLLRIASRIGDNILSDYSRRGFFVPSSKALYTKFDYPEPLALLHLYTVVSTRLLSVPQIWPSRSAFNSQYFDGRSGEDTLVIYSQTRQNELSMLLRAVACVGKMTEVETLIAKGADVNAHFGFDSRITQRILGSKEDRDTGLESYFRNTNTPLHYAADRGHKDIVELLIAKGADINAKNNDGQTPLHYAVEKGHNDIAELFIADGADINAKNNEGQTLVDIAVNQNRSEVVKLLVAKGANISIHAAARIGDLVIVENLIQKGTDLNTKDASGRTALHYAVEKGHKDIVELLIANGANVNAKDKNNDTPAHIALGENKISMLTLLIEKGADLDSIHLAARKGDLDRVKSFIEKGTNVNETDSYGATPLHYAAMGGSKEVVEFLIARGAYVNVKKKSGDTPLHGAAISGRKDVVELLIDNAANVNARGRWDYTPIYYAVWSGVAEVVELLVEKGADVNAKDEWGWTPLHYAADGDKRVMAQLLINKGADVNAKDNSGETSLSVAKEKGHTVIVELLKKHGAKEDSPASEESPKPTKSLPEAAAIGDIELVRSLLNKETDVDSWDDSHGKTALQHAAMRGHKELVELLLDKGARIDAQGRFPGGTPLHYAIENSHEEIVELLIASGADVNERNLYEWTPLHEAVRSKCKDIVALLIDNGANINAGAQWNYTPIHYAAWSRNTEMIELLVEKGADINAKDEWDWTPLHYMAQHDYYRDMVEFLIAKGADVNAKNNEGQTPVDVAVSQNHSEIVKLLIEKGADVSLHAAARQGLLEKLKELIGKGSDINAADSSGQTALHYAARRGHKKIVELLLVNGANVNTKDSKGLTPAEMAMTRLRTQITKLLVDNNADISSIHLAAFEGNLAKVKTFLQRGINIKTQDSDGRTPLHYAATADVAEFLISKGADIHTGDKDDETPLHTTAGAGFKDVVELLIKKGADVNADKSDYTPLSWAIWRNHKDVIRSLVIHGADVNFKAKNDWPFLHYPVWNNDKALVEFFVDHGAKLDLKDKGGWTVLHYAGNQGYKEILEYLVSKGADINAKTNNGKTALSVAKEKGHTEIVELLRKQAANLESSSKPRHDVSITNIVVPTNCVQGDTVTVIVTADNPWDQMHTLEVTLMDITDGKRIEEKSLTISARGKGGMDETCDLIFDSPVPGRQFFGYPVICGDVNGDGYDDLLVGASQWNNAQGRAYLYYGGKNMDTIPDKIFTGEGTGDWFGDGGASLGDVNGDKFDDVLVGASNYRGGSRDGRVYIFHGGPDIDECADLILEGESGVGGYYGATIVTGDVNNDGYEDVVVTAVFMNSQKGRAYLYYGGDLMDNTCDLTFDGENANDWFGRKAAIGGDVNGDGYPDLIIGARRYPSGGCKGRSYLFYGGDTMDNICDKTFTGESNDDKKGEAVHISDIDNDGFADVIIGAWGYNAGSNQGRVYLYWGETNLDDTVADKTFTGEPGNAKAAFGNFIWIGYVNNDNYGDLLIAGFGYHNGDARGRAYIYYGDTKEDMNEAADCTFTGEIPGSQPNRVTLGDVNNDRYDDAIIGGYAYNNGQGRVWLYYSSPMDSAQLKFNWNTTNASVGKHTLKVEIPPIPGEKDISNNTMTVTVEVKEPSK